MTNKVRAEWLETKLEEKRVKKSELRRNKSRNVDNWRRDVRKSYGV